MHYMRRQETGGSIIVTASASSFQRFRLVDYTIAKHGVLGLIRGLQPLLHPQLPIRINGISPSWSATGLAPKEFIEMVIPTQTPAVVAKSVALLMADETRHGQLIYSAQGEFSEIEESVLLPAAERVVGDMSEDLVLTKLQAITAKFGLTESPIPSLADYFKYCPLTDQMWDDGFDWEGLSTGCTNLLNKYCNPVLTGTPLPST